MRYLFTLTFFCLATGLFAQKIKQGMTITASTEIPRGVYKLDGTADFKTPAITIQGNNITVDFNNSLLVGSSATQQPDSFFGIALYVKNSHNVLIKNLKTIHYKISIVADNSSNLKIENCNLSYNYRPYLYSTREREVTSDWLSYHNNDKDEWMKYGCGIYLKDCRDCDLKAITITQSFNGIMLSRSEGNDIRSSVITYNSGIGIGLYRSSNNKIVNNQLDYNVRGYSNGVYRRGQDAAGLLVYEQSSNNIFAYNSATHCGDGLFLWAGQSTMNTGIGGCNDNNIYSNDFSYATNNGIEATFSKNRIVNNTARGCDYGLWAGYSYGTMIANNRFGGNNCGVAIEHGNNNTIRENLFNGDSLAIWLFTRDKQPADWGFAKQRDVKSHDYDIDENSFFNIGSAFKFKNTSTISIKNNYFSVYNKFYALNENSPGQIVKSNKIFSIDISAEKAAFPDNKYYTEDEFDGFEVSYDEPVPNFDDDCDDCFMPPYTEDAVTSIVMNNWGPYNGKYPYLYVVNETDKNITFKVAGNLKGTWKMETNSGFKSVSPASGNMGAIITAVKDTGIIRSINLSYTGQAFVDQKGDDVGENQAYTFAYKEMHVPMQWKINFQNYDSVKQNPLMIASGFEALKTKTPVKSITADALAFNWYNAPAEGVNEDNFATFASTEFDIAAGDYKIFLTSDDGVRMFIDGKEVFSDWTIHEPKTDVVSVKLGGHHKIEIEHFDKGGFSTLDFYLSR